MCNSHLESIPMCMSQISGTYVNTVHLSIQWKLFLKLYQNSQVNMYNVNSLINLLTEVTDFEVILLSTNWFLTLLVYPSLCLSVLDDQFKWNDDTVVSFTNWVEEDLSDWGIPLMDKCVVLHSTTGKWENISCTEDQENGVVCETAQSKLQLHYGKLWHCIVSFRYF